MARCTSCEADNPASFRYCGTCGSQLPTGACAACGLENQAGQRFCGRCGAQLAEATPVAEAPSTPRGERKLATVLFADVVGFTSLAEDTDPEALASTVDAALRRVAEIVVEHGGTVDKYIGDALMALFGVPAAHGDDAERAVAAALAISRAGGDLRFSIGINSGEVMIAPVGDGGGVTAMGDAVNVAERLEKTAGAGEILIGPLTAELAGDRFVLREREAALLKGKRRPIAVYQVTGPRAAGEAAPAPDLPLVDRTDELEFLHSCWRQAVARSRCQVVLLTGDAGIGKTRLADELARLARPAGLAVHASCPGYGSLVGARVGLEIARQLSDPGRNEADDGPAIAGAGLDDQGVLRLRRLLAARAAERPVLLVIDDSHNAAPTDLDPLAQLAARSGDLAVMFLLVGRSQPATWLGKFGGATTIRVGPLDAGDARRLAAAIALEHPLAAEAAEEVAARSGGNPLHLRELMRLLTSSSDMVLRSGEYHLDTRPHAPASLNAVLSARIDALPSSDKAVLQVVAIFSDGATVEEISSVALTDVASALDRLVTGGLLREAESARFEVSDPLLQEVAYGQLPHATRGELHCRAAEVASSDLGRARHLRLAAGYLPADPSLRERGAGALAATGLDLLDHFNFRGAIELLRQAVELGHREPPTLLRLAQAETDVGHWKEALAVLDKVDAGGDPRVEAQVLHARGNALGDDPELAIQMLDEAAARWSQLGDEGKRGWALANRGVALFSLGRTLEASPPLEEALAIFTRLGDRAGVAASGQQLALVRPDDPRLPAWLADGVAYAEDTGDLAQMRNALIPLAWVRFIRSQLGGPGFSADALGDAQRLAQVSSEIGDEVFELQGHCLVSLLRRLDGDPEGAEAALAGARRAGRHSEYGSLPLLDATSFVVALARGAEPAGRPAPSTVAGPLEVMADALVIEGLLLAGHVDAAVDHLAGSALDVGPSGTPLLGRLVGVTRGAVLVLAGRHAEAEESLSAAREAAKAVDAFPSEVAAIALLAESRCCQGRDDEARRLLDEVRTDPGGVARLLVDRVRVMLGDAEAEHRLRAGSARLLAPGLTHIVKPAATA